jgi:hypothetical protein
MSLEIVEFVPVSQDTPQKPGWIKLGMVKLQVGAKFEVQMEVIKGKDGNPWFRIPNVKVGDAWKPAYHFTEKTDFGKWVTEELKNEFKNKYM